MSTYLGQADLKVVARFNKAARATLASLAHTRGDLHKPGETNSIGLVMMGAVEFVGARDIVPSGTNREYGYWRGGYNRTFLSKFDQAFFPLEGSGIYAGVPQITITQKSSEGSDTCADSEILGDSGCTWMWDEDAWFLYSDVCAEGCGCEGTNPDWAGFMFDMISFDCVGGTTAGSAGGVGTNVGYAEWAKAGTLNESLGQEAPQQRSLFLSKRSFVSAGSGIDLSTSTGYSVYAKVVPSGDITGTVMIAQHKENPAQFILGCDYDGKYYVRSDQSVSGVNVAMMARSEKAFEDYQYPAQVIGVYASGDSRLRIYVNGREEGVSAPFIRDKKRASNSNVVLGKREFGLAERGFTGWVDEAGVSSRSFEPSEIRSFHDNTFNITDLIFNTKVTPTGDSGLSGRDFGDTGLDALNADYVELVIDSGVVGDLNPTGAKGGAFDQDMWGQANHAVSSVLTFDLTQVPPRFHQLTDLSVDLWVEHSTNHPSGADLSTRLINKKSTERSRNLSWHPSGVSIPSGTKRLVSISHPLEHEAYYRDGQPSFMQDFDDHQLEIVVKYPKTSLPYDSNFKIYSSKVQFSGFDSMAHFNTQQGLIEAGAIKGHSITNIDGDIIAYATGDRSLTMVSVGASPVLSSGIMNMFIDTATADQALNLVLNHDPQTSMGDTARGFLFANAAIEMSGRRMNLYTVGGLINTQMRLFLKTKDPFSFTSPVVRLEIAGSELSFPRAQKTMPLFFTASEGFGKPSDQMNLTMPQVIAPVFVSKRLLYIKGLTPVGDIPLYLQANEQIINTTPLFTKAPKAYKPSSVINMFVQQKDFFGKASLKAVPSIVGTGNIPLFMHGYGVAGLATGTQATGTVSITDTDALQDATIQIITTDGTVITATEETTTTTTDTNSPTFEASTGSSGTKRIGAAANLATCLNANSRLTATSDGYDCTITQVAAGSSGNTTITLTFTASAGATKTDFAGGLEPTRAMNFVMPNVLGSGTNTTTLRIRGYQ